MTQPPDPASNPQQPYGAQGGGPQNPQQPGQQPYEQPGQQPYGQPGGMPQYPQQAAMPQQGGGMARPDSLKYAVYAWIAVIVLQVIGSVIGIATAPDAVETQQGTVEVSQSMVTGGGIFSILFTVIVGGLVVWQLWKGKNWARVLCVIYGVYLAITAFASFAGTSMTGGSSILSLLSLLVAIVAAYFMFRPDAKQYIRAEN